MKNMVELRNNLSAVWEKLESGAIEKSCAAEFSNIAGKMINSTRAQIEYYALRKVTPKIAFLEEPK